MKTAKKPHNQYICSNCSYHTTQWVGKCPQCNQWNTLVYQETIPIEHPVRNKIQAKSLKQIETESKTTHRHQFASSQLNEFFSVGLATHSLTLLAGEPGLGKSTLCLQLARSLLEHNPTLDLVYLTSEESVDEVGMRAKRIGINQHFTLAQTNTFEELKEYIFTHEPEIVIVDSIQTLSSTTLDAVAGSITQVTRIATELLHLAKSKGIAVIMIGHVTKEGAIAGPRTLEHLVDSVLLLERTQHSLLTLSFQKHRFGTIDTILFLTMNETGLEIVKDPSLLMLENLESGIGIAYGIAMMKNQPVVIEIQTLVNKNARGGFGIRQGIGIKQAKLLSLIALLQKYTHIDLSDSDVFVTISGIQEIKYDDSLDLAVLLAILSSVQNTAINTWLPKIQQPVFSSRVTLSGKLRKPTSDQSRLKIAKKLSLSYNPYYSPYITVSEYISIIQSRAKEK